MSHQLADAVWPDIPQDVLVLVPVGSIEQHGPHLPLETDSVIAEAVASQAAGLLRDQGGRVLTAPVLTYGASGEHQSFPGTASIGIDALRFLLIELVRSLRTWADRVVFVNAHGGNIEALRSAVGQLSEEGHNVAWVPCATEEVDAHAGYTETSLMLHLRPGSVRSDQAAPGNTASIQELLPEIMRLGVGSVSASGVLGDPSGASALEGLRVLEAMTADVVRRIRHGARSESGMLRESTMA